MLKALMCGLSGIYRDFVSQQNFPTDSLSEESEFCISLTTTKCIMPHPVRELDVDVNINKIPKLVKPYQVFDQVKWFGMNHCTECGLVDTYCSCLFETQSGAPADIKVTTDSAETVHENIGFSDQEEAYTTTIVSQPDPTRMLQDNTDVSLENFFSRPIKIYDDAWETSQQLNFQINPWAEFFGNPRNLARITNFKLLRCELKIKVLVNGNPFQYGRAMLCYLPFRLQDFLTTLNASVPEDLIQTSQLPKIFIDPCASQGGEMVLPMFLHHNYIDVSRKGWEDLGELYFRSIGTLQHANGAVDQATISIFAWAENVHLSGLTSFEPQSGDEVDEANSKGIISGPASAVSAFAAHMVKVPYIGPFAMATQIAAGATAAIAKLFGYSRPTVTKAPEPYRPTVMSSLSLTNAPDVVHKLSLDHKQELSIDPRIAGLSGVDPLNIKEIAKRESYFTTFVWSPDAPPESTLYNVRVSPVLWRESVTNSFHFPACAFAALPFKYWTGSMKFRFQIVASAYHRGRLKFVYDPERIVTNEYNTNYTHIVDISEKQDFTIEIGQSQINNLLEHSYPGVDDQTTLFSVVDFTTNGPGNGVLGIYVVNELTVPNTIVDNSISINMYVSMGDDFEVFVPDDHFQKFVFAKSTPWPTPDSFEPQSGVACTETSIKPSSPQSDDSVWLGLRSSKHPDLNKVWVGESVMSLRTILKRYNLWTVVGDPVANRITTGRMPTFPYLRGAVPDAVDTTGAAEAYNYCNTVALHWVRNAFQGWRGSIRYKYVPRGMAGNQMIHTTIQRAPWYDIAPNYIQANDVFPNYPTLDGMRLNCVMETSDIGVPITKSPFSGVLGCSVNVGTINPVTEFELPWYSNKRFEPGKRASYTGSVASTPPYDYRIEYGSSNISNDSNTDVYVAAGEDFQVYFFTGLPPMYYEARPPDVG